MNLLVVASLAVASATDRVAPAFSVSLDDPPQARWVSVATGIMTYHGGFNTSFAPVLEWLDTQVPTTAWIYLDPLMDALQSAYGEYDAELQGLYEAVVGQYPWVNTSGLFTLPKLIMLQMAYEFGALCTSIATNQINSELCTPATGTVR
jgi:hypothetical protein